MVRRRQRQAGGGRISAEWRIGDGGRTCLRRELLIELLLDTLLQLRQRRDGVLARLAGALRLLEVGLEELEHCVVQPSLPRQAHDLSLHDNGRRRREHVAQSLRRRLHARGHLGVDGLLDLDQAVCNLWVVLGNRLIAAHAHGGGVQRLSLVHAACTPGQP